MLKKLLIPLVCILTFNAYGQDSQLTEVEKRNLETYRLWGEEVWGKGNTELMTELVTPIYTRHNGDGTREVTREEYGLEVKANLGREMKFLMQDTSIDNDLLWIRYSGSANDPNGNPVTFKGIQVYRFEHGKLTETWVMGGPGEAWNDPGEAWGMK